MSQWKEIRGLEKGGTFPRVFLLPPLHLTQYLCSSGSSWTVPPGLQLLLDDSSSWVLKTAPPPFAEGG